jgi:hypothetical protein
VAFNIDSATLVRYHASRNPCITTRNPEGSMYKILGSDQKEYGPVTAEQVQEWIRQRRADAQTMVRAEGAGDWKPLGQFPEFAPSLNAPPPVAAPVVATIQPDNPISTVVPYKNPKALIAYYLGIFSLIPCFGLLLGIAAFILGILGLKFLKTHPMAHGKVHAWIGIILGGLCALANIAGIIMAILGARH